MQLMERERQTERNKENMLWVTNDNGSNTALSIATILYLNLRSTKAQRGMWLLTSIREVSLPYRLVLNDRNNHDSRVYPFSHIRIGQQSNFLVNRVMPDEKTTETILNSDIHK